MTLPGLPLYRYLPRPGKEPGTPKNPAVSPGGVVTITVWKKKSVLGEKVLAPSL